MPDAKPVDADTETDAAEGPHHPAAPVVYLLRELAEVVDAVDDGQYTQASVGEIPGTIGGHVRHCLDHVQMLLDCLGTGQLCYDHRDRGTDVETSRPSARAVIDDQAARLEALPSTFVQAPVSLRVMMTAGGAPTEVDSSVGRELAFVLSHTIHHNAMVRAMVQTVGGSVPERFGYAPSTVAFSDGDAE